MQWFENEDFWNNFAPIMFDSDRWAESRTVADSVINIAKLKEGFSVLDAGCGPGRISIELALKKLNVTGVDIIQSELDAAKEIANDENVKINFLNKDLRYISKKDFLKYEKPFKAFDCAINLYTSFGYCNTKEEDFAILKNIANLIKEDGTFILECTSREIAILYYTSGEEFEKSGLKVKTQFSVQGLWEGLVSHWTVTNSEGKTFDHTFTQRLYSGTEYKQMMLDAGFKSVEIYGDFDLSPYNEKARTMVVVSKK